MGPVHICFIESNKVMGINQQQWDMMGISYGGFHKWYPKMDGFIRENPVKMDDLGVPMGTPILGNFHITNLIRVSLK